MKRTYITLALALLLSAPVSTVEAKAKNCVPDQGCAKKQGPPKCCTPPPCEFWQEYQLAWAKWYYSNNFDPDAPVPLVEGRVDYLEFTREFGERLRKWQQSAQKCGKPRKVDSPPIFSVMPANDCRIEMRVGTGQFLKLSVDQDLGLRQALDNSNSCEEIVQARHAVATARSSGGTCFLEQNLPKDYAGRRREFTEEARREFRELDQHLSKYWSACSSKFSSDTAKKVLEEGLGALKDAQPTRRPKAKRNRT
jgi:hypothetical protein